MPSTLDLDLTNPATASQLTCVRSTVGYHNDLSGNWTSFPVNTPRITNRGLRIEMARTNSLLNSSTQGAATSPAPGVVPTGWDTGAGLQLSAQVIGVGVENGIEYIDWRVSGTLTYPEWVQLDFQAKGIIPASPGQVWVGSVFVKLLAGSLAPFYSPANYPLYFAPSFNGASNNYLDEGENARIPTTITGQWTRLVSKAVAPASTTSMRPYIYGELYANGPIDFTLRIGWPQTEQVAQYTNAVATSPIRTTSAAVTRASDYVTVNNFSTWYGAGAGSMLVEGGVEYPADQASYIIRPANNANDDEVDFLFDATNFTFYMSDANVAQANVSVPVRLGPYKLAAAWASNDVQFYARGVAAAHDTAATLPTLEYMQLGHEFYGCSGPITRFAYWPRRLTDAELDAATTDSSLPNIDLDLTNPANASQLTATRASVGYHDNLAGVWSSFAANTPRITNRGLRVETTRTNSISNNSMQGAVAGSPSILPTNWTTLAFGMAIQVVGKGTEKGVDYIDVRLTSAGAGVIELNFEGAQVIAAANGQTWVNSAFFKLLAGDPSPFGWFYLGWSSNNSAGAYINDVGVAANLPTRVGDVLTRLNSVGTIADATAAYVQPYIYCESGGAVDVTLRIGWPQMERNVDGYYNVTSPIRTTTVAATRAAEDVTINTFGSWYSAGDGSFAIFGDSDQYATVAVGTPGYLTDAAESNFVQFLYDAGTSYMIFYPPIEGVVEGHMQHYRMAVAWALNDAQYYANGAPMTHRTSNTLPTFTAMHLGTSSSALGYNGVDGPITRFKYWPRRLTDTELETETFPQFVFDTVLWADKFTEPVDVFLVPTMGRKITATKFTDPVESFGVPKMGVALVASVYVDTVESAGLPVVGLTTGVLVATLYESPVQFFGVPNLFVFVPPTLPPHFETEGPTLPTDTEFPLPPIVDAHYQADGQVRIYYEDGTEASCVEGGDTPACMQLDEWVIAGHTIGPYAPAAPNSYVVDKERDRRIQKGIMVTLSSSRMVALQTRTLEDFRNINFLVTTATAYKLGSAGLLLFTLPFSPSPFSDARDTVGFITFRDAYNIIQDFTYDEMIEIGAKVTINVQDYYLSAWTLKTMTEIPPNFTNDSLAGS